MPAFVIDGTQLLVDREGAELAVERSEDVARTPNGNLRAVVLGATKRVLTLRSVPMPWASAQAWLAKDQTIVSVSGDYVSMTAWCEVDLEPMPMGYGRVRLRLQEV